MKGLVKLKLVNRMLTVKSRVVGGCLMVTEVMTWRMAQGVTMMMNIKDTALRDLTTLAVVSASRLSLIGRLATEEPSNIGSAERSMCLKTSVCEG